MTTTVKVFKQDGSENGTIDLNEKIFGIEPNENVLFDAVVMQQASLRQGTHDVKNRSEVSGGGRKPWRQKGTGRARQGSIRSPQWVGGGTVFGPTPRSYSYKLPKKVRRLAIKSALSQKAANGEIIVVDALNFSQPKTKDAVNAINALKVDSKALFVIEDSDKNVIMSFNNIPDVKVIPSNGINVLDVMKNKRLVLTKSALTKIEEALA